MLTLTSRYNDLVKVTHGHESECNCVYCRRRRLLFCKLILRNGMIFFSMVGLTATGTMIVCIFSGSAIVLNPEIVLVLLLTLFMFCLGMLYIADKMR